MFITRVFPLDLLNFPFGLSFFFLLFGHNLPNFGPNVIWTTGLLNFRHATSYPFVTRGSGRMQNVENGFASP